MESKVHSRKGTHPLRFCAHWSQCGTSTSTGCMWGGPKTGPTHLGALQKDVLPASRLGQAARKISGRSFLPCVVCFLLRDSGELVHQLLNLLAPPPAPPILQHRDLKMENSIFEDASLVPIVKVIDFGLSAELSDGGTSRAFVGTVLYTAPEVRCTRRKAVALVHHG